MEYSKEEQAYRDYLIARIEQAIDNIASEFQTPERHLKVVK